MTVNVLKRLVNPEWGWDSVAREPTRGKVGRGWEAGIDLTLGHGAEGLILGVQIL